MHIDKALIYAPMAFAILVEALNLVAASRRAKREHKRQQAVKLRPRYVDVDESVAVTAALSKAPGAGSVGLSGKPVAGDIPPDEDARAGLG